MRTSPEFREAYRKVADYMYWKLADEWKKSDDKKMTEKRFIRLAKGAFTNRMSSESKNVDYSHMYENVLRKFNREVDMGGGILLYRGVKCRDIRVW